MFPIVNTVVNPVPVQTLVATPLPDAVALHVPVDNVPPSVSNAQVNNNARGNNGAFSTGEEETPETAGAPSSEFRPALSRNFPSGSGGSAQTEFIAQLISQDISGTQQAALQGILAQYEKIVAFSFVKYKPSNATLPPPEPPGILGKVLQQQKTVPTDQEEGSDEPASDAAQTASENIVLPHATPNTRAAIGAAQDDIISFVKPPIAAVAVLAYADTVARNHSIKTGPPPATEAQ